MLHSVLVANEAVEKVKRGAKSYLVFKDRKKTEEMCREGMEYSH